MVKTALLPYFGRLINRSHARSMGDGGGTELVETMTEDEGESSTTMIGEC